MRMWVVLAVLGSSPAAALEAAAAQSAATGPDITVTGDNRVICRRVTRTATRMRTGRICRTQAQWAREAGSTPPASDPNSTIDGAADSLEMGGEKVSTNCIGGELIRMNGRTPLGPR
jgi:hypothetical protein